MTPSLRVALLTCLTIPLAAHAATYKCVVDGKTSYQQRPCEANATQREVETGPPKRVPPVRSVPVSESTAAPEAPAKAGAAAVVPPKGELDAAGREALAREAFAALKARDLDRFGALLCASAKQKYARPDTKSVLPTAAGGIAARQTEIGDVIANEPTHVHFAVTEINRGEGPLARVSAQPFSVGLEREAGGRTCVSGFGTLARGVK